MSNVKESWELSSLVYGCELQQMHKEAENFIDEDRKVVRADERVEIAQVIWRAFQIELDEKNPEAAEALGRLWETITSDLSESDITRAQPLNPC